MTEGYASIRFLPDATQERKLWAIYWAQRSAQRLKGRQLLYFQYPFFQYGNEADAALQPLLRWPSQLTPPVKGSSYWALNIQAWAETDVSYALNAQPAYNKNWCVWANERYAYDWDQALKACLQADGNGLKALSSLAQMMTEKTAWQMTTVHPALHTGSSLGAADNTTALHWLASVGLNAEQWDSVVDQGDINAIKEGPGDTLFPEQLNLLKLDPYQYQSLIEANNRRFTRVTGKSSSGKTHTIIEGLKANLLMGKPCLVVAGEKASLKQIQASLEKIKLGDLVFHWHNEATDSTVFQAGIQTSAKMPLAISAQEKTEYLAVLGRQNRVRRLLGELYAASRKPVFQGISWSVLLGYYLREARKEGKELLASQLSSAHFQFTPQEFSEIKSSIEKTKPLYEVLGNIHHPLSNLNAAIFVHQSMEESKSFIHQTTNNFLATARKLHQNYVRRQSQYADQLAAHYETHYRALREQLQQLSALLEDAQNEFGADVLASGENTLKLYSRFSKRFKKAADLRLEIIATYGNLQRLHEKKDAFNVDWPPVKLNKILSVLKPVLENYQRELGNWRTTFSAKINDELIRLNHKTALESLKVSATILPIEQELEVFIDEINASGLYQLPLHSKTLTLSRQQKNLEEIIGQLERSRGGVSDYDAFYKWQRNWFSLTETTRKTIQALLRSLPDDWIAAFSSWYLNECLSQSYHPFPVVSDALINDYLQQINSLRSRLPDVIHEKWATKHNKSLAKLKNILKNKPASTTDLLKLAGSYLPSVYPIALASPEMAHSLAPYYEIVYLENAQTLSASSVIPIAKYCQQMIAFSNRDEVPFLKDGIVPFLAKKGIKDTILKHSYRLNFAQQALALGRKIKFHALEGRFNEEDQHNEVEAFEVLKILNSIQKTPQQTYPSVGVICMTEGQRNKIQELFYRIKKDRHTGVEIIQQLERNGLKVMTGDEMTAQHFDHIIFSAVHAPVDFKGHLSPLLSSLNEGRQMATLTALENMIGPHTKWAVLSSLPQDELKARTSWSDKKGEQRFGRLLELLFYIAKGDDEASFLQSKHWDNQPTIDSNRTLAVELKHRLSEQLPDWNFEPSSARGRAYSFLQATSPHGVKVALLADGFLAESDYTTTDWEHEQQEHLRLADYKMLSFSTESLWKDPSYSCLRIVNRLKILAEIPPATEEE